ncbi:MAG: proline--tRNA ligase [Methanosarcinales archaeon]|nr:proline--tRNA ligase [Methanosarcinales archaeon]
MQHKTETKAEIVLQKENNFSEWYSEILKRAEILDIRYPVKGVYVWYPYGYKIRNLVYGILRSLLDNEHEEVQFPLFIPKDELMKEKEHIKGFEDEVFWVTKGGSTELDIPLALRPTSETAIYPVFKVWIRSHRDLPLRIYQIVNTFRYETKHTRPLIRLREITSFKEAHTAHVSRADAEEQVKKAVALYKSFFDQLAIPYVITQRPAWDKFPGAEYSIAFDTLMPDGRTLQIGTIHLLGESFARTFDIKYEDKDGSLKFVNQTCYGISERCVASVIAIHGDDHGLVLPPKVAPIQVVIVPIVFSSKEGSNNGGNPVEEACVTVYEEFKSAGIRAFVDNSEDRPGAKYYRWEMKGVPLRIEIGPRDLKTNSCEFVRRDNPKRMHVPLNDVVPEVKRTLEEIQVSIHEEAKEALRNTIYHTDENIKGAENSEEKMAELRRKAERGIMSLFLCDSERCGQELEEQLGVSVLGEAVYEAEEGEKSEGECMICSRKAKRVYVARAY